MSRRRPSLSMPEFVALIAMMFATVAFSIDAMLPAMDEIAAQLTPGAPNRAQLIITSFVFGMGVGTLFTGPLADAFGRKRVIVGGALVYVAGALLAWAAGSLELVLAARALQGLGAAGPRIAALAVVRDLYQGRQMARVVSFAMIVFTLVPAIAPLMGAAIIDLAGWRSIFLAFVVFSTVTTLWFALRQPETMAPENRRPFRARTIAAGIAEMAAMRQVVLVIAVLTCSFGILFTAISTAQPVFDQAFGRGAQFPYWFGLMALLSGTASLINARIVVRLGMRRVITATFALEIGISTLMLAFEMTGALTGTAHFAAFLVWFTSLFFFAGLTIGNLNALGMEPLGHLAGLGASIIGSVATVAAVLIAVPVGLAFDGTPLPVAAGVLVTCIAGLGLMRFMGPGATVTEA